MTQLRSALCMLLVVVIPLAWAGQAPSVPIYALEPQSEDSSSTLDSDFVLRGARQLRISLYALTRELPLLPCCDITARRPSKLVSKADVSSHHLLSQARGAVVIGVKGSAALDAMLSQLPHDGSGVAELHSMLAALGGEGGGGTDDHLVYGLGRDSSSWVLLCIGASPIAAMYAASTALEALGVRFHVHGDSYPRPAGRTPTLANSLLTLSNLRLLQTPSMSVRGILPFHDFTVGPDWWDTNDYMFTMEQLAKMKLNFFGLHTYQQLGDPENPGQWGNWTEPAVWTGLPQDVNPDGAVKRSYTAGWTTTTGHVGQNWC